MRKSGLKTRLARARVAAGLTQEEFSKVALISIDQIRHFERGGRPLTSFVSGKLSQVLGVSGAWLDGIGDDNEPVALDGDPYTSEKYLEHKARHLCMPGQEEEQKKMTSETRALLAQRAKAWEMYLTSLLTGIFSGEIDWFSPLADEEIGLQILSIIREHIGDQPLPDWTVDTIMRELKTQRENTVTKPCTKSG
jgi:transcriptional regulator with XRE-family HTH domain